MNWRLRVALHFVGLLSVSVTGALCGPLIALPCYILAVCWAARIGTLSVRWQHPERYPLPEWAR